jgi:hypothetical protein
MTRRQRRRHLTDNVEKRVIIRDENLNVVAHLGELGRGAYEIRYRSWISVPDKDVKILTPQVICDAASDDAKPNYTDILSGSTRHVWGFAAFSQLCRLSSLKRNSLTCNPEVRSERA